VEELESLLKTHEEKVQDLKLQLEQEKQLVCTNEYEAVMRFNFVVFFFFKKKKVVERGNTLGTQLEKANSKVSKLKKQIAPLEEQIAQYRRECDDSKKQKEKLQSKLSATNADYEKKVLESEEAKSTISNLQRKLKEQMDEKQRIKSTQKDLEAQIKDKTTKIESLQTNLEGSPLSYSKICVTDNRLETQLLAETRSKEHQNVLASLEVAFATTALWLRSNSFS